MTLEEFLRALEERGITFTLAHQRPGFLMVEAFVPGQHWEVEFSTDGANDIEVEVFTSGGVIEGVEALTRLLSEFGEAT